MRIRKLETIARETAPAISRMVRSESGIIAINAAVMLPLAVACVAMAVDVGAMYLERRTAQGAVDLAAINAAELPDQAETAARSALAANGFSQIGSLVVTKGRYVADPAVSAHLRFQPGSEPFNAVRVEMAHEVRPAFAAMFTSKPSAYSVSATAAIANAATFSVGTRLAAIRGGLPNALLGALAHARIDLSVMDYEGLVDGRVRLDGLLNALAVNLGLEGASYEQLLDADASVSKIALALAAALGEEGASGPAASAAALGRQLALSTASIKLRTLLDLGDFAKATAGTTSTGLAATVAAMDVLRSSLMLANAGQFVSVDLALDIPNVMRTTATLFIGEPKQASAWASVGKPGSAVRTAQLRLRLISQVGGTGALAGTTLRLPVYVEAAYADARLADVTCADDGAHSATVAVTPGLVRSAIGDVGDAQLSTSAAWVTPSPALIVRTGVATVEGRSEVRVGNTESTNLVFTRADVDGHVVKRAETSTYLTSIVTSLLQRMSVDVKALGLALNVPGTLGASVAGQLHQVAAPLDETLHSLLEILGMHLGEADVELNGIRCGGPALIE